MQPVRGSNELWMVYFIIFLLLGAFFLCELFIGVIIENFARYVFEARVIEQHII